MTPPRSGGETCGPDACTQPGYCDGYHCRESGRIRPAWGKHFVCAYPECDCAISFPDGHVPGRAECPSPCNPYGEDS